MIYKRFLIDKSGVRPRIYFFTTRPSPLGLTFNYFQQENYLYCIISG